MPLLSGEGELKIFRPFLDLLLPCLSVGASIFSGDLDSSDRFLTSELERLRLLLRRRRFLERPDRDLREDLSLDLSRRRGERDLEWRNMVVE